MAWGPPRAAVKSSLAAQLPMAVAAAVATAAAVAALALLSFGAPWERLSTERAGTSATTT
jgi:hypothetical protein